MGALPAIVGSSGMIGPLHGNDFKNETCTGLFPLRQAFYQQGVLTHHRVIGASIRTLRVIDLTAYLAIEVRKICTQAVCQFVDLSPGFVGNRHSIRTALSIAPEFDFSRQKDLFNPGLFATTF